MPANKIRVASPELTPKLWMRRARRFRRGCEIESEREREREGGLTSFRFRVEDLICVRCQQVSAHSRPDRNQGEQPRTVITRGMSLSMIACWVRVVH